MPSIVAFPLPKSFTAFVFAVWVMAASLFATSAFAQFGGGAGGGPGGGGGGAQAPAADDKPRFRDHIHTHAGMAFRRERGDSVVAGVRIVGNRTTSTADIYTELQTRKGRFYDYETVLTDVRRLNDMGSFDQVTFEVKPVGGGAPITSQQAQKAATPAPQAVEVTFFVHERPMVVKVIFHGNRALNEREISGRVGVTVGDPLSEFTIESGRRRLMDYYQDEGFNQVARFRIDRWARVIKRSRHGYFDGAAGKRDISNQRGPERTYR